MLLSYQLDISLYQLVRVKKLERFFTCNSGQEPLDVVEMFDAWNGRLGWIKSMHSSVNQWTVTSYTSWVRLGFWESHPKRNHFELRWVTCPGMLARRAGWKFPVSTVVSFHFSTSVHHFDWFFSGCAAGPLPNGCLMVCGGGGNRKLKPLASTEKPIGRQR